MNNVSSTQRVKHFTKGSIYISNAKKIALLKTISWRFIGTLDTMIISFILTGNMTAAFSIGGVELITKMTLYYFHERTWSRYSNKSQNNKSTSIFKSITWRIIGSIDTTIISWLITGDAAIAISITGIEVVSKMILYYFHERLWLKISNKLV